MAKEALPLSTPLRDNSAGRYEDAERFAASVIAVFVVIRSRPAELCVERSHVAPWHVWRIPPEAMAAADSYMLDPMLTPSDADDPIPE